MIPKKDTCYITGKITGERYEDCYVKFEQTENELIQQGYDVINPMKVITDNNTPWIECMEKLIPELAKCTHVKVLPCSYASRGARIECAIAKEMRLIFM